MTDDFATAPPAVLPTRWALLGALLAAEVVGLTLRFDTQSAAGRLPELLLNLPRHVFEVLVVLASVALLVRGVGPRPAPARARARDVHRAWPFAVAHLAALAAFTWLTAVVLEGGARPLPAGSGGRSPGGRRAWRRW